MAGFQAGVGQATNSFPAYGQGAAGFGKRFGAAFADQVSSNFFSNFAYPVLLKEDPRYFRLGQGTIKHRILYSLAQEFVTRTDKGTRRFNFSNVLGAFSTGGLSNVYYPQDSRGFGLTMSRSALSLAYGSAGNLIDEFWFDVVSDRPLQREDERRIQPILDQYLEPGLTLRINRVPQLDSSKSGKRKHFYSYLKTPTAS